MKKAFVLLFVFLFALMPLTAFAENGEEPSYVENKGKNPMTITLWSCDEYTYAFELTTEFQSLTSDYIQGEEVYDEGSEEFIDTSVIGRKCFGITAEKAGYYGIVFENPDSVVETCSVHKADDDNFEGIFKDRIEIIDENNFFYGIVFNMKANEKEYAFIDEIANGNYSVKYVYFGDKIVSAETDGPLVYEYDTYSAEGYEGDECFPVTEMYPNVNIKFSSGKTAKICTMVQTRDTKTSGTVDAEIPVFDEKFPIKVSYIKAEDLVTSISLPDGFEPNCVISYDGVVSDYTYPDYILVKPKNGEAFKAQRNDHMVLSNGRSYDLWTEYYIEEEGVLTNEISFSYSLNGISENEIKVTPETKSVFVTFKEVLKNSKANIKIGIKILKGKAGDWTKEDGYRFITSYPTQMKNAVKYYAFFGEYFSAAVMFLIAVLPLILLAVLIIIILLKVKKKRKKKKAKSQS